MTEISSILRKNSFVLVREALQKAFPEYSIVCARADNTIRVGGKQAGKKVYLGDAWEIYKDVEKTKKLPKFCKVNFPLELIFKGEIYHPEETPKGKEGGYKKEFILTRENLRKNKHSYDLMICQAFEDSWPEVDVRFKDYDDGVHVCVCGKKSVEDWIDAGPRYRYVDKISKLIQLYSNCHPDEFPWYFHIYINAEVKSWTSISYVFIYKNNVEEALSHGVEMIAKEIINRRLSVSRYENGNFITNLTHQKESSEGCIDNFIDFLGSLCRNYKEKNLDIEFPVKFPLVVERKKFSSII